jgi:hypothetical protein
MKIIMKSIYKLPMLILLAFFSGKGSSFFISNEFYSKILVNILTKIAAFISIEYSLESKVYLSNLLIFFIVFCVCIAIFHGTKPGSCRPSDSGFFLNVGKLNLVSFVVKRVILLLILFVLFFYYPLSIVQNPFSLIEMFLSIAQITLWYLWANTVGLTLFVTILYFHKRKP